MTLDFFATVQNKLHYAVHEHTDSELIYERVDREKPSYFESLCFLKEPILDNLDVKVEPERENQADSFAGLYLNQDK